MKKLDFPLIADSLFYAVCTWFSALCVLRYFKVSLGISIACATLFALATGALVFLFTYGRHKKRNLTKREKEEKEALMLHLALERPERVRAALLKALVADEKDAHCEGDELALDGVRAVPMFTMQPVSADSIAAQLREGAPFVFLGNALTPEAQKLLSSFGCKAICGDEIYELFTRTETTPCPLICSQLPRRTVKDKFVRSFKKTNARPFFVSGLLLMLMSLFAFFPVYYLVSGSV
ncbi:MAG: hypothetical protein K2L87_07460, partial [Clostridiales bacterium]|nr:hypothetical protein [Clostridiales bacterium]